MKKYLFFILVTFSFPSQASSWEGIVTQIDLTLTSHVVLIELSGKLENAPRCNKKGRYAIDTRLPSGKLAMAFIRTSYEHKKWVSAIGLNTCSNHFKAEGLKNISFKSTLSQNPSKKTPEQQ